MKVSVLGIDLGKNVCSVVGLDASGAVVFTTAGSAFDTIMGVYNGTTVSTLVREPSAISDDDSGGFLTSKVSFNAVANQEYEIVVDGYFGASGDVVLSWQTPAAAPSLPTACAPMAATMTIMMSIKTIPRGTGRMRLA